MSKITQKLLTEKMIPITPMNGDMHEKLKVVVDGQSAECYIASRIHTGSSKIVILFEEEHPQLGFSIAAKNFHFEAPGILKIKGIEDMQVAIA